MSGHQITGNNGYAAVMMRAAISNVEFSPLFELGRVLVRLDHVACFIATTESASWFENQECQLKRIDGFDFFEGIHSGAI